MSYIDDLMDKLDAEPKTIWCKIERAYWTFHHWIGFSKLWRFTPKFIWQHITRGFPDHHMWNLDTHLANHIAPRLRVFSEYSLHSYPCDFAEKYNDKTSLGFMHWKRDVKKLSFAFEKLTENNRDWMDADEFYKRHMTDDEKELWFKVMEVRRKFIQDNLEFFGKNFLSLWD